MIRVNNRLEIDWHPGMTVDDLLAACGFSHHYVAVSINDKLVPPETHATHPVADGDNVQVIHIIGGG